VNGKNQRTIVDACPLVALLSRGDQYHQWALEEFARLTPPLFTCEAVLSEVQLLVHIRGGQHLAVLEMVKRRMLHVEFQLEAQVQRLLEL
jgi:hypothetical protein